MRGSPIDINSLREPYRSQALAQLQKGPVKLAPKAGTVTASPLVKEGPKLNKTESAFYEILKRRHPAPAVIRVMPWRFQLGFKCSYLPDFAVIDPPGRIAIYETKGAHVFEDGWVKFKMAARTFPEFRWILAQLKKGVWTETQFS